jgi:hypothetical protein
MDVLLLLQTYIIENNCSNVTRIPTITETTLRTLYREVAHARAKKLITIAPTEDTNTALFVALRLRKNPGRKPKKISTLSGCDDD